MWLKCLYHPSQILENLENNKKKTEIRKDTYGKENIPYSCVLNGFFQNYFIFKIKSLKKYIIITLIKCFFFKTHT